MRLCQTLASIVNRTSSQQDMCRQMIPTFSSKLSQPIFKHLIICPQCDRQNVLSVSRAYTLMKDLVDSPALSLGPSELQATAEAVGE